MSNDSLFFIRPLCGPPPLPQEFEAANFAIGSQAVADINRSFGRVSEVRASNQGSC
jgi:hypothetical protein